MSSALTKRERDALQELFYCVDMSRRNSWLSRQKVKKFKCEFYWARKRILIRRFFKG